MKKWVVWITGRPGHKVEATDEEGAVREALAPVALEHVGFGQGFLYKFEAQLPGEEFPVLAYVVEDL